MKQTAVEWVYNQLHLNLTFYTDEWSIIEDIMTRAKEMEKEQIDESHWRGFTDGFNDLGRIPYEYYNETYKNTEL